MARDQLRIAFVLFAAGSTIGGLWDFAWHATNAFESFLSPPHLTVYLSAAGAALMLWITVGDPATRRAFERDATGGERLRASNIWKLDPGLLFAAAGMGVVLLSGPLDLLWHGAWGVDETRWSTPHAMFGWGLLVATLGFWSARNGVVETQPMGPVELSFFSFFTFSFAYYALLLPYAVYPTSGAVEGIASLEAVRASPGSGHTFRIYAAVGVTHSSAAYSILTGLWAGAVVAQARAAGSGTRPAVAAAFAFTFVEVVLALGLATTLGLTADWTLWWPAPILAFTVLIVWTERAMSSTWALVVAATALAALVALPWVVSAPPSDTAGWVVLGAGVAAAVPSAFVGARAGALIGQRVRHPGRTGLVRMALLLGIVPPLAYGALDLCLRWSIL